MLIQIQLHRKQKYFTTLKKQHDFKMINYERDRGYRDIMKDAIHLWAIIQFK